VGVVLGLWMKEAQGRKDLPSPRYLYAIYQNNISQKNLKKSRVSQQIVVMFGRGGIIVSRWEMMCYSHGAGLVTLQWQIK